MHCLRCVWALPLSLAVRVVWCFRFANHVALQLPVPRHTPGRLWAASELNMAGPVRMCIVTVDFCSAGNMPRLAELLALSEPAVGLHVDTLLRTLSSYYVPIAWLNSLTFGGLRE